MQTTTALSLKMLDHIDVIYDDYISSYRLLFDTTGDKTIDTYNEFIIKFSRLFKTKGFVVHPLSKEDTPALEQLRGVAHQLFIHAETFKKNAALYPSIRQ